MERTYEWQETRKHACAVFGYPEANTEQAVLDAFTESPLAVTAVLEKITSRVQAGKLGANAGWLIVSREVENIARPVADIIVSDAAERERERERAVQAATRWIRNAGLHFDRESEITDELFGDRGMLRAWEKDVELQAEIVALWRQVRPIGEQLDREALERAAEFVAARSRALDLALALADRAHAPGFRAPVSAHA